MEFDEEILMGLEHLSKTLDDASEVLASFLTATAKAECPSEALVDSAHQTIGNLVEWRDTLLKTTRPGSNDPKKH